MTSSRPYLLRALYEWILDNGLTPYILVDAEYEHVEVPQQHIKNGQIVLNVTPHAVQNFAIDNESLSFNARFSGKTYSIYTPIKAILAIYASENGRGMVFPQDLDDATDEPEDDTSILKEVSSEDQPSDDNDPKDPPKGPPHLRIVK